MTGDVEVAHLDLADLTSVRKFADSVQTVDVLVNNVGVFGLPLTHTVDGFEATIGTNHLGHFALTCLLGDKIQDRVVSVASRVYALSRIHFDDLHFRTRRYTKWSAYGQSKMAVMLFVQELARRGVRAYATDPGSTNTDIARESTGFQGWSFRHKQHLPSFYLHTPEQGARASIQAVTTDLPSGTYLAPRFNQWGKPKVTKIREKARDPQTARRLWELSAELTGCDWPTESR